MALTRMILLAVLGITSLAVADTCSHDNCYRAFNGGGNAVDAEAFCSTFTLSVYTSTEQLPARATACSGAARISSVCSCAYPSQSSVGSSPTTTNIAIAPAPTATGVRAAKPLVCNRDNCLRAMVREGGFDATAFCATFTTAVVTNPAALPTYATQCVTDAVSQISSACSCVVIGSVGTDTSTSLSSSTISSTLIISSIAPSSTDSSTVASSTTLPASSSSTTPVAISTSASRVAKPLVCNRDNCLRAMVREGGVGATAFCATFTTAIVTNSAALPTYASQCVTDAVSQISSACSCVAIGSVGSDTSMTSSSMPSSTKSSTVAVSTTAPASSSSSSTSSIGAPVPTSSRAAKPLVCNRDNCLRAMVREGGVGATAFCATFTTAIVTNSAALPTYASQCVTDAVSQISSACSCVAIGSVGSDTSMTSSSMPSSTKSSTVAVSTTAPASSSSSSSTSSTRAPVPTSSRVVKPLVCNRDNCLRAMVREGGVGATAFCATFTTAIVTNSAALPTYASQCVTDAVSQISSACSCVAIGSVGSDTSMTSSSMPSSTKSSTVAVSTTAPASSSSSSSSTSSTRAPVPTSSRVVKPLVCNRDNCLRAMVREGGVGATAFCASFTTTVITNSAALPTYATQCVTDAISQISSACSCVAIGSVGSDTSTSTSAVASSSKPVVASTTVSSSSSRPTSTTPARVSKPLVCNRDNCLRAMVREGGVGATAFCASFTTAVITNSAALPTYATQCVTDAISQISSACSCVAIGSVGSDTSTSTSAVASSSKLVVASTSKSTFLSTLTTLVSSTVPPTRAMSTSASRISKPLVCNRDNCLRAMVREGGVGATAFCGSFTTAVITNSAALPTYATQCVTDAISQISSACSCVAIGSVGSDAPTTTSTFNAPVTSAAASTNLFRNPKGLVCNRDNCLRAMVREGGIGATPFCASFTTAVITNPAALPTYATQCVTDAISQISSACSCVVVGTATATN